VRPAAAVASPTGARGWRRFASETRTFAAAMIALAAAAIGLLFQLVPSLKPDPRERIGAALQVHAIEPGVQLREWIAQAHPNDVDGKIEELFGTGQPPPESLRQRGEVVFVRTQVDGFKHRAVTVRARLYNHRTQERVPTPFPPLFAETSKVKIDAPNRTSVQLLFVGDLTHETEAEFLRIELIDSNSGEVLAVTDSPTLVRGRTRR
jgi:hypothetical protein